jgi:hypothetical protein
MRIHSIHPGLLFMLSGAAVAFGQNAFSSSDDPRPITGSERLHWVTSSTLGPTSLLGASFGAGLSTLTDGPPTYGTHWDGFGKRVGINVAGSAVSNTMEAGLGAIWGEDPRYTRGAGETFKNRVGNIFKMTYMARNRDGKLQPAYARFIAIPSSNFLSNTWRSGEDATVGSALSRTAFGFLGHLGGNTFHEFWPDFARKIFRKNNTVAADLRTAGIRQ